MQVPPVLFEDNHLLAVNKPAGLLVQGDTTGDVPLVEILKQYIGRKYAKPGDVFLGVVHRLDRPVSGVIVFARTSKALARMNALFREKETRKIYWAVVAAKPARDEDTLVHWLVKDEQKNRTTAYTRETPGGQRSELSYKIVGRSEGNFLLEVTPVTGRSHQIRAQLARAGSPILGDMKYGGRETGEATAVALHARHLEFIHPVKQELVAITAELPQNNFWRSFASLS
jgi:23S rRNA pseudouridine1911/1915/1917 synthase